MLSGKLLTLLREIAESLSGLHKEVGYLSEIYRQQTKERQYFITKFADSYVKVRDGYKIVPPEGKGWRLLFVDDKSEVSRIYWER